MLLLLLLLLLLPASAAAVAAVGARWAGACLRAWVVGCIEACVRMDIWQAVYLFSSLLTSSSVSALLATEEAHAPVALLALILVQQVQVVSVHRRLLAPGLGGRRGGAGLVRAGLGHQAQPAVGRRNRT